MIDLQLYSSGPVSPLMLLQHFLLFKAKKIQKQLGKPNCTLPAQHQTSDRQYLAGEYSGAFNREDR